MVVRAPPRVVLFYCVSGFGVVFWNSFSSLAERFMGRVEAWDENELGHSEKW